MRSNEESSDSPFKKNGVLKPVSGTKTLKQKLCGGISEQTPTYFQLKHVNILDQNNRIQELHRGYQHKSVEDLKLITRPDLHPQEKRNFEYEDFSLKNKEKIFDYSSMKPSDLIDVGAGKRPLLRSSSNFYTKYNEELNKKGFHRKRGIFTIESNQKIRLGQASTSRFGGFEEYLNEIKIAKNNMQKSSIDFQIIKQYSEMKLPVTIRTGKKQMNRFLSKR